MGNLTGRAQIFHGPTTQVDDSAQVELGTRAFDEDGNEWIYLKGVATVSQGSWVSFDEAYATTLLAANAVGRVAIADAAVVANKYGWFQIYGKNIYAKTDTVAADKALYIDGTAGRADDAGVAGDAIFGAWSRTADTANVATVELNYPFVMDGAYLT